MPAAEEYYRTVTVVAPSQLDALMLEMRSVSDLYEEVWVGS